MSGDCIRICENCQSKELRFAGLTKSVFTAYIVPTAVTKGFVGPITGSDKPTCLQRNYKKGGHDFLDAVIVLPSGFAVSPGHLPAVPVHENGVVVVNLYLTRVIPSEYT